MKDLEKLIAEAEKNAIPDEKIDYSDIPPLTKEELSEMRPAYENHPEWYRPQKTKISLYIDNDVLATLKAQGKGYQTRINEALRAYAFGK